MPNTLWGERISAVLFIAGALYMGWLATDFPAGGDLFPLFVSGLMVLVAGIMLARTFVAPESFAAWRVREAPAQLAKPIAITAVVILYVLAIFRIGYYTTTFALLVGLPVAVGLRRPVFILASAAGATAFIYALFELALGAQMPRGLLF
ncbi:tripartite tricarboxylate transporter TctB family protein [Propylenella binzhouense]|uniref:Tripartite tricarboxylate transporter TctB family protein n=1 Tax=Propylenella binzhouense TaxID=2555902 RepID=A0A964TA45_9HYPH|nr:tripartite tricarboxylate transporter TctB family protein [Propylenella binzhouense]MYZ50112.1 tripartite tricarboxylate transporter TctB family protein [Propylenella binzhouense]